MSGRFVVRSTCQLVAPRAEWIRVSRLLTWGFRSSGPERNVVAITRSRTGSGSVAGSGLSRLSS